MKPPTAPGPGLDSAPVEEPKITYVPLSEIKGREANPKAHALDEIKASLVRFGFVAPVIIDDTVGELAAGHGRVKALRALKAEGAEAPGRIKVREDGEWMVPAVTGITFASEEEAEAYLIADNRPGEIGGWHEQPLYEILKKQQSLEGLGYVQQDVRDLFAKLKAASTPLVDPDEVLEPPETPVTHLGDLWLLGPHRVLCGDAESAEDVAAVLAGETPLVMATDPPYGVGLDQGWRDRIGANFIGGRLAAAQSDHLEGDNRTDWSEAWKLSGAEVVYLWHAGIFAAEAEASLLTSGFQIRQQIVWVKPMAPMSRSHYHWRHEPCWYGVKKGATARWIGDRKQTTVWEAASPKHIFSRHGAEDKEDHPTQKPIELWRRPLVNHLRPGEVLYDPFLGSGTAVIAAERHDRKCYGLELIPAYVDLICRRYQRVTGDVPVLERTGEAVSFEGRANGAKVPAGAPADTETG